jgi:hypothetical protein
MRDERLNFLGGLGELSPLDSLEASDVSGRKSVG